MKTKIPTFPGWRRLTGRDILRPGDRGSIYPHTYKTPIGMYEADCFRWSEFGNKVGRVLATRKAVNETPIFFYRKHKLKAKR